MTVGLQATALLLESFWNVQPGNREAKELITERVFMKFTDFRENIRY